MLEIINSVLIILATAFGLAFVVFVAKHFVFRLVKKTPSKIDDELVHRAFKPIYVSIVILGVYFTIKSLSFFDSYEQYVNNSLVVIAGGLLAYFFANLSTVFVDKWLKVRGNAKKTPKLINKIVAITIYLIAAVMILSYLGVEIAPILATLGVGGIAVGLALQDTLSNLFSGIQIISDQPIKVGDYVEVDKDTEGYVEDINWRSVRIKTIRNNIIVIPNSVLANTIVRNNSAENKEMSVLLECGVAYDSDLEKVEKVAVAAAKKVQKSCAPNIKDFEPFIRFHTFADSNINFTVIMRADEFLTKYQLQHELVKGLKKAFDKEGIEISWPVRKIVKGESGQGK